MTIHNHLTLIITSVQVVKTSMKVNNNSFPATLTRTILHFPFAAIVKGVVSVSHYCTLSYFSSSFYIIKKYYFYVLLFMVFQIIL